MNFYTSKNLSGVGAILVFVSFLALPFSTAFGGFVALIGLILMLIGVKGLADYYREAGIFNNVLYGTIAGICRRRSRRSRSNRHGVNLAVKFPVQDLPWLERRLDYTFRHDSYHFKFDSQRYRTLHDGCSFSLRHPVRRHHRSRAILQAIAFIAQRQIRDRLVRHNRNCVADRRSLH